MNDNMAAARAMRLAVVAVSRGATGDAKVSVAMLPIRLRMGLKYSPEKATRMGGSGVSFHIA